MISIISTISAPVWTPPPAPVSFSALGHCSWGHLALGHLGWRGHGGVCTVLAKCLNTVDSCLTSQGYICHIITTPIDVGPYLVTMLTSFVLILCLCLVHLIAVTGQGCLPGWWGEGGRVSWQWWYWLSKYCANHCHFTNHRVCRWLTAPHPHMQWSQF